MHLGVIKFALPATKNKCEWKKRKRSWRRRGRGVGSVEFVFAKQIQIRYERDMRINLRAVRQLNPAIFSI